MKVGSSQGNLISLYSAAGFIRLLGYLSLYLWVSHTLNAEGGRGRELLVFRPLAFLSGLSAHMTGAQGEECAHWVVAEAIIEVSLQKKFPSGQLGSL